MRRTFSIALILILGTVISTGVMWGNRSAQALNIKVHIKDLSEEGLSIVSPSDAAFDELVAALTRKKTTPVELLKPFSVFIKNKSDKAVVAYKLRWECMKADGSVVYKDAAKSSAWVFMGEGGLSQEQTLAADTTIIRPRSTWFHSLIAQPQLLEGDADSGGGWAIVADNSSVSGEIDELLRSPSEASALRLLNAELAKYTSVTISLDGVFYFDGTFVGPNTTGFFDVIKAQVDAKSDLLREVKAKSERGVPTDQIFQSIEEVAAADEAPLGISAAPVDYYNSFRKTYAKELAAEQKAVGGIKAVEGAVRQLSKPWTKLSKR